MKSASEMRSLIFRSHYERFFSYFCFPEHSKCYKVVGNLIIFKLHWLLVEGTILRFGLIFYVNFISNDKNYSLMASYCVKMENLF